MAGVLTALGKDVRIINAHRTPPSLEFLDPEHKIEVLGDDVEADEFHPDCIMVLDTSAWAQLGEMGDAIRRHRADKIVVDHHVGQDDLGATFYKDTTSEATGSLVVQAADAMGVEITKEMAVPLFAAIATDTGWFRFGSVSPMMFQTVARLNEAGAIPAEIYGDLYERDTLGRLKLRGLILSRTESELDGALVHTHVKAEDFGAVGALPSDTEDAINLTLAVKGTKAAVIFVGPTGGRLQAFLSQPLRDGLQRGGPSIWRRRPQSGRRGVFRRRPATGDVLGPARGPQSRRRGRLIGPANILSSLSPRKSAEGHQPPGPRRNAPVSVPA